MTASTIQRVCRIAADILQRPVEQITLKSSLSDFDNWDSIRHLNLILALEQEFNVEFEPDEIERINSLQDISLLVESTLAPRT